MKPTSKQEPRSYVVRVYRRTARQFAGSVEDIRTGRNRAFSTAAELWAAIGGPAGKANSPAQVS